jgi:hypothetical protein
MLWWSRERGILGLYVMLQVLREARLGPEQKEKKFEELKRLTGKM